MVITVFHCPTAYPSGEPIHPKLINNLLNAVLMISGGFTLFEGDGAWLDSEDRLIREPVLRVVAACPEDQVEVLVELIHQRLKQDFRQEAVYMEVDGKPSIR